MAAGAALAAKRGNDRSHRSKALRGKWRIDERKTTTRFREDEAQEVPKKKGR